MVNIFHCYEFLFLKELDNDLNLWKKVKGSVLKENCYSLKESTKSQFSSSFYKAVSQDLWFIPVTIAETRDRFPAFIKKIVIQDPLYTPSNTDRVLSKYLQHHDFVEMHLDSIFKHGENNVLPKELFRCPNLKVLSLRYNFLEQLPPDIGKLQKLEYLALTNNKLQNFSIPYSLSFCKSLKVLSLDNNLLDALPGFLLLMPNLNTVHRHGNHNYFKATFMWYHTDINERILAVPGSSPSNTEVKTLQLLCAIRIIATKMNFFTGSFVPPVLVDYLCSMYLDFNVCYKCSTANLKSEPGFKVYTFRNPYLGNSCVPFLHWACSIQCAEEIEIPAREEQILASIEQDRQYNKYVQEAQCSNLYNRKNNIFNINCCIL